MQRLFYIMLANKNSHERDQRITFEDENHVYTIDGKHTDYTSVTTLVHQQFEGFDADKIITKMMNSKRWPKSNYFGQSREEIKALWERNREEAATSGTKLHYDIECYYNGKPNENNTIEYHYFKNFLEHIKDLEMEAYRTEWFVFDEDLKLAGSIDMCFTKKDGTIAIYDWKRSKEIKKSSYFGKFSTNPAINHIPDLNFWHYSLQLNVYKYILERKYSVRVSEMKLVCLHPNHSNFKLYDVANLSDEVSKICIN
jgi:ATP-dependent exoDNAse (exonuclease V) beta subunit